jgi:hypothetical protein
VAAFLRGVIDALVWSHRIVPSTEFCPSTVGPFGLDQWSHFLQQLLLDGELLRILERVEAGRSLLLPHRAISQ